MEYLADYGFLGLFMGTFLAATIIPFSSEILLTSLLLAGFDPMPVVLIGTAGNWSGGISSYGLGLLGKWEWIEKYLGVKQETVAQKMTSYQRYGIWLSLLTWLPLIGDLFSIGLGFIRAPFFPVAVLTFVARLCRFTIVAWLVLQGQSAFGG